MKRFLPGFVIGLLFIPVIVLAYFRLGRPPVAIADRQLPFEKQLVRVPLRARIEREKPTTVPIPADEAAFTAGASIYHAQCVACHGLPDHPSAFATHMFPRAPQLFVLHGDHIGVTDDEPGEIYWIVANGIRLSGMPAYDHILTQAEMWQVTLLLTSADKLPPSVQQLLTPPATPAK